MGRHDTKRKKFNNPLTFPFVRYTKLKTRSHERHH